MLFALRLGWAIALIEYARKRRHGPRAHRRLEVYSARALAARELAEALATARRRDARPHRWSSALDALHAVSMLPVAVVSRALRRDAIVSAMVAWLLALLSR